MNFVSVTRYSKQWSIVCKGLIFLPGSAFAKVKSVESFATKHEVKRSAASFWWRRASSDSRPSWNNEFPEMFLVPPAPAPWVSNACLETGEKSRSNAFHKSIIETKFSLLKFSPDNVSPTASKLRQNPSPPTEKKEELYSWRTSLKLFLRKIKSLSKIFFIYLFLNEKFNWQTFLTKTQDKKTYHGMITQPIWGKNRYLHPEGSFLKNPAL